MAIPFMTEADAEPTNENNIDKHDVDESLREFKENEIFLVTERAHFLEAKIEEIFQVLFEVSKILDKKLAKVLEKVAEVDQKITDILPPSAA
jgi:hypothetical protein